MAKLTAFLLTASVGAAAAHPSLTAHDHPHGIMALAGLDMLLVAACVAALALAAWQRVRS